MAYRCRGRAKCMRAMFEGGSPVANRFPQVTAVVGGFILAASGLWAFLAPESFFESAATFEPYNQHFLQDIGSLLVGLGAVLLLASLPTRSDGLALALLGVGIGAMLHAVSHIIGRDLGG